MLYAATMDKDHDKKARVIKAIEKGDLSELHRLLEDFPEWDIRSEHLELSHYISSGGKQFALHLACMYGHLNIVEYLVFQRGCSVTQTNLGGLTPLVLAWFYEHWEVVLCLLNYIQEKGFLQGKRSSRLGLSVEAIIPQFQVLAPFENDSLRDACKQNLLQTLQCLCKMKRNSPGLHASWRVACASRDLPTMQFIIKYGNFIYHEMPDLHKACLLGDETVAIKMINESQSGINSLVETDKYGMTPVHYASCEPHLLHVLVRVGEQMCDDIGINMKQFRDTPMGNTPLHYAVMCGCLESLDVLASLCGSLIINIKNNKGYTPLHLSVKQLNMLVALLKYQQCRVNETDDNGETALHMACRGWKVECVRALIQNERCDPNIQLSDGSTALHVAVGSTYTVYQQEIVQVLLESDKTDPNMIDDIGQTALHLAVIVNHFKTASLIVKCRKCRPNIPNKDGNTPLHCAIASGKLNAVGALISSGKCSREHNIVNSTLLLHRVVDSNIPQLLSTLLKYLDNDCSINEKDDNGETLLHKACRLGNLECIRVLIKDERCDPNIQLSDGSTALHVAVGSTYAVYQQEIVQVLMESDKIDPNINDNTDQTPFHSAIASGKLNIVEALISSGKCRQEHNIHTFVDSTKPQLLSALLKYLDNDCSVNEKDDNGETALHKACRGGKLEYIRVLIGDKRCDPNIQLRGGSTALHVAVSSDHTVYQQPIVQCLLKSANIDPNLKDNSGQTPLHIAVERKHFEIAFLLFKHSTHKPNLQDNDGNTALHLGVGSLCVVELFLSHTSIDLNIQNSAGNTPLHEAVIRGASCDVVKALVLHKSCDPNIINKAGMTPLQCAISSGQLDYVEILISSGKCSHEHKSISDTLVLHRIVDSNKPYLFSALLKCPDCSINEKDSNGETALHKACRDGKLEYIHALIKDERCDTNIQLSDGSTALHIALSRQYTVHHHEAVQCLLESDKIDPNCKDNSGQTPLHIAVVRKNVKTASLIIKHSKVRPNLQDNNGSTALHLSFGSIFVVERFLSHTSIDLNIQNSAGNTPLHEAVIREASCDVVKALVLHKSCDPNIVNTTGMTPLQCAIASGELDYVEILISSGKCSHKHKSIRGSHRDMDSNKPQLFFALLKCPDFSINKKDSNGRTALHKACRKEKLEYIRALIEDERCDPNIQLSDGSTALHVAISSHYHRVYHHEAVQCLLKSTKIDPNLKDNSGQTPLHIAVVRKHFKSASLLLKRSTHKPNLQDNDGNTALHLGVGVGSLYAVELFLSHTSIDLNIQNSAGNTPLHEAVIREASFHVVKLYVIKALVLHKSCDPNIVNKAGMTPLQCAIASERLFNVVKILISSGKCSQEPLLLHKVVKSKKVQLLSVLLKSPDCSVNEKNGNGETALHKACIGGKLENIRVLIGDKRCDPNIQLSDGSTALHVALSSNYHTVYNHEVVQCLLESATIDPNLKDNSGQTPLHIAVVRKHFEIASLLLQHSTCKPNLQDNDGNTALHLGVGSLHVVRQFLSHTSIDLNIQKSAGNTPLHEACVKALVLHKSCDPNISNTAGMTPLQYAIASGKLSVVGALISSGKCSQEHNIITSTLLHKVVDSDVPQLLSAFLKYLDNDCSINEKDDNGETALHKVCRDEKLEYIRALIEDERCDPNIQFSDGSTALHVAISSHYHRVYHHEAVQCLLKSTKIDPNLKDNSGQTPLHIAVVRKHFKSASLLLKRSTHKPNLQDNDRNTALHLGVGSLYAVCLTH